MVIEIDERRADPRALAVRYPAAAAIDSYLANEAQDLKPSTFRDRRNRLRWWRRQVGKVPLRDLSRSMVRDQLERLTCSGASRNRYQTALAAVLSAAQEREWVTRNVAREIKRKRDAKRRERVITGAEWRASLKAAKALAAQPQAGLLAKQFPNYLRVLYATGMRAGEALNLEWRDVDLDRLRLVLRRTKTDVDRVVPLSDEAEAAFRAQHKFRREHWPWVFVGRSPLAPACRFNRQFDEAKEIAGIGVDANGEPLVLHSLRHSFSTELAEGGADLFELMAATGHKSIASAQRYIKTKEEQAVRALLKRKQAQ